MNNATIQALNNVDHKDLKVITHPGAAYGDAVMLSLVVLPEFRHAQSVYPLVFHKNPQTGEFYPVALFGFSDRENLFLHGDQWAAGYVPLYQQRGPFLIGQNNGQQTVHINVDHPRISKDEGEPLFLELGGHAPLLEKVINLLDTLHHGISMNKAFIEALLKHELIESFSLDVSLNNGQKHQLLGFYTINEDKLNGLDGAALGELSAAGHLEPIYMMLASQAQFSNLLAMKNRQAQA
ncbi:SapC family protein [Bowmanella sp. JS7-9]|uniref:SapC family protein n=1 Tax=Pseudobowmanella zhangzhouensis TaxID=1537679 RepID=A0ABW1XJX8_9ALTE|nr:SapC family protein [Bowmanella sp. JS7-9]TBX25775.1 hypothetical protein TK45_03590 [Bowmanella sp. JS7-9]